MIEQLKATYNDNNWVKIAAFVGLLLFAVIFAVLSGGFPPWAWRFLFFSVLPDLPHLMAEQGGAIFSPLLGLILLSLALLIVWVVIVTFAIKIATHLWQAYHSRQSFDMGRREAEQHAGQNIASDELDRWFEGKEASAQPQRTPRSISGATSTLNAMPRESVAANRGVRASGGPIYPETPMPVSNPTSLVPAVAPVTRERPGPWNQQSGGQKNGEQDAGRGRTYNVANTTHTESLPAFNADPVRKQLRVAPPPSIEDFLPEAIEYDSADNAFFALLEREKAERLKHSEPLPSARPPWQTGQATPSRQSEKARQLVPEWLSGQSEPLEQGEEEDLEPPEWLLGKAPPKQSEETGLLSSGWLGQLEQLAASGRSGQSEQIASSGWPEQSEQVAPSEQAEQLPGWLGQLEQLAAPGRSGQASAPGISATSTEQLEVFEQSPAEWKVMYEPSVPVDISLRPTHPESSTAGPDVPAEVHEQAPVEQPEVYEPSVPIDISLRPTHPESSMEGPDAPGPYAQAVHSIGKRISVPAVQHIELAADVDQSTGSDDQTDMYDTIPFDESTILKAGSQSEAESMLRLVVGLGLDPGIKRRNSPNEDSLFAIQGMRISDNGSMLAGLFMIADGMGGHANGREASRLAIRTVSDLVVPALLCDVSGHDVAEEETIFQDMLKDGVHRANLSIYRRNRDTQPEMMGTTLTAALIANSTAYIGNVGDSRTYLYRPSEGLKQITRDHSEVALLVESGAITPEEIYTHPQRNRIYRCLGERASVDMDLFTVPLQPGDVLVLCSDGLWEMVRDSALEMLIASSAHNPTQMSAVLVQAALNRGGLDNIGVVTVGFLEAKG